MVTRELYDTPTGAVFSPCRLWRYVLWRAIEQDVLRASEGDKGTVNFIMLNPSTADESKSDPTITRCIGYATDWGYSRLVVTNLFAFRATEPDDMLAFDEPVGGQNDGHILDCARDARLVICAWGNDGKHKGRSRHVRKLLRDAGVALHALKINGGSGEPGHPLYLKKDLRPMEMPA